MTTPWPFRPSDEPRVGRPQPGARKRRISDPEVSAVGRFQKVQPVVGSDEGTTGVAPL